MYSEGLDLGKVLDSGRESGEELARNIHLTLTNNPSLWQLGLFLKKNIWEVKIFLEMALKEQKCKRDHSFENYGIELFKM